MTLVRLIDHIIDLDHIIRIQELIKPQDPMGIPIRDGVRIWFDHDHVLDLHGAAADALVMMIGTRIPPELTFSNPGIRP